MRDETKRELVLIRILKLILYKRPLPSMLSYAFRFAVLGASNRPVPPKKGHDWGSGRFTLALQPARTLGSQLRIPPSYSKPNTAANPTGVYSNRGPRIRAERPRPCVAPAICLLR